MSISNNIDIAIIGGSGVYDIDCVDIIEELNIDTPFGKTSDKIAVLQIDNIKFAFIPRHGKGHYLLPREIPSKANIYALKSLGVRRIIAISAVGSLRKDIEPKDFVVPSQIIDRTMGRDSTFFGNGIVGHISFAEPFCPNMQKIIYDSVSSLSIKVHKDSIYLCMEGPAFSTKAESNMYRLWGANIIGMTAIPEAKLAREAEICYSMIAMATDYDCWYGEVEAVNNNMVVETMKANINNIKSIIPALIKNINNDMTKQCSCENSLLNAIMTDKSIINDNVKNKLALLYSKYIGK